MNNKVLGILQRLGKALMMPVAVLPAAALLLRLGAEDVLNIKWMFEAGNAIFSNLPLIFAIGIAIGFAEENNGTSALAAAVGYFVLTKVSTTFNDKINMGVLAGIIVGLLAGYLYNKYKAIKLPDFLGFFGGKRFVPIVTSFYSLIIGVIMGYLWPLVQNGVSAFGNFVAKSGAVGGFLFGLLNRLLIPFGLHHVINSFVWFQFGEFRTAAGKIVTGDLSRFFAGDKSAGVFMTGFFPIMMFALPAVCLAMIAAAKKEQRKNVAGMLLGAAFTSFLTGITEPIEFLFMFVSPILYVLHAILTGISLALTNFLGIRSGFGFSAGFIDYVLNYGISTKPLLLIPIGLLFGVAYYFLFYILIIKLNVPTPGRIIEESEKMVNLTSERLKEKANAILQALGGKENIQVIDACVTRIRVTVNNPEIVDENQLKQIGATGIIKMGNNNLQIVVGTSADPLVTNIKAIMRNQK